LKKGVWLILLILVLAVIVTGCGRADAPQDVVQNAENSESGPTPGGEPARDPGTKPGTVGDEDPPGQASGAEERNLEEIYARVDQGQGGVWVNVLWVTPGYLEASGNTNIGPQYGVEDNHVFAVFMTTHSGDLLTYDMMANVRLRVGTREYAPTSWEYTSRDSHHPAGILKFPKVGPNEEQVIDERTTTVELVFKNLAGVAERVLRWDLPLE